ncbi:MAG: LytTR family DNA-binding domain-containing protein [Bryobacteraceae bacterium]
MRVLIADDEPVARDILREHVESTPGLKLVGEAATGNEALERIVELAPDLVLLDLEMPERNGLNVVRSLRGGLAPLVIFVTAYDRHALEAFEVGAVDYLLKPVRRERFERAIEKARKQFSAMQPAEETLRKIVGKRGGDLYLLDPAEVIAFRAEGELVHVVTASQQYLADQTLKALEQQLERPRFRRIHRSTIINTDHIRKISALTSKRWLLKMSNGLEAVVSKRMAGSIREQGRW